MYVCPYVCLNGDGCIEKWTPMVDVESKTTSTNRPRIKNFSSFKSYETIFTFDLFLYSLNGVSYDKNNDVFIG